MGAPSSPIDDILNIHIDHSESFAGFSKEDGLPNEWTGLFLLSKLAVSDRGNPTCKASYAVPYVCYQCSSCYRMIALSHSIFIILVYTPGIIFKISIEQKRLTTL